MISYNKFTENLMKLLLCGLGIHYMIITILFNDTIIFKFWKETVIIIYMIGMLFVFVNKKNIKFMEIFPSDGLILLFIVSLIFSAIFMTESTESSIYMLRVYLVPIIVYFISKNSEGLTKDNISKIFKFIFLFYTILALWGIFQAYFLGDDFLINIGYPLKYAGRLKNSYYFGGFGDMQRVVSTFANVNVYACVIGFITIMSIYNKDTLLCKEKNYKVNYFILVCSFILTFSRSNWLAIIILLFPLIQNKKGILKKALQLCIIVLVVMFIYFLISKVNILKIISKYIINTISMNDHSSNGRFGIWQEGINQVLNSPFGIGLGNVGTRSAALNGDVNLSIESSYLALLLDTGVQGFIPYILFIIYTIYYVGIKIKKESKKEVKLFFTSIRSICLYLLIIFTFSNHIHDLEIMIFFSFFVGLAYNKKFIESITYKV